MVAHTLETHAMGCRDNEEGRSCNICDGGLAFCKVCRGAEASLPTECPGRRMTDREEELVTSGRIDFVNGQWVTPAEVG